MKILSKIINTIVLFIGLFTCICNSIYGMSINEGILKKQFNIITITRNKISKYDEPVLLNEIFVLFKNIDNLLGGRCFDEHYDKTMIKYICEFYGNNILKTAAKQESNQHITLYYSSLYSKIFGDAEERKKIFELLKTSLVCPSAIDFKRRVEERFLEDTLRLQRKIILKPIKEYGLTKYNPKIPTLLIFQENMFSQTHILDDEYVNFIIDICKKFTLSYNISISINLLHQFNNDRYPCWLPKEMGIEQEINSTRMNIGTIVANYSLIISKGEIANVYIKTLHDNTLKDKHPDLLIKEKFILKSGTFSSFDLIKQEIPLSRIINTRICSDMNSLSVDCDCEYDPILTLDKEGILVIQSNTFSLYTIKQLLTELIGKKDNIIDSYINRFIIHCDPGNGACLFELKKKDEKTLDIFAYKPTNTTNWPRFDDYGSRIPCGTEIDVNNKDCEKDKNSKLFYINIWTIPDIQGEILEER